MWNGFFFLSWLDTASEWLEDRIPLGEWLQIVFDFIESLRWFEQLGLALLAVVVIILGLFSLIRKLTKLIIVVAVLAGIYIVVTTFIL